MSAKTILIAGAGIGGPTLAYWLKAAGFEPTLVERAPALRSGGYVIDFWGLGYDIAERMGLIGDINHVGYHIREMRIVDGAGKRIAGFGLNIFNELTGGRFVTLRRSDLSRLLFEKIEGATEVIFGDEIAGLRESADRVEVQFKRAGERHFDLVVGADGLHSPLRAVVFGPQARFETQLGYLIAAFEIDGYRPRDPDIYVLYNEPSRMLGRVTLRDDRSLFLFVFSADPAQSWATIGTAEQKSLLRRRFGDGKWECQSILDALDGTQDLYFDHVSQIKMPRWSKGRVALVGDAAFCVSLMAGQGAALAMTAAYVLAGELAKAGGRHDAAFDSYEAILRPFIDTKQRGAERFAAAFAPKTQWGLFIRNQVIRACAVPGLARFAFGKDLLDKLQLAEYRWSHLPIA
jgi:2-polyprenyl-6-methoxyphenol hydroxylase-like FAD-dependent oxidoreductase